MNFRKTLIKILWILALGLVFSVFFFIVFNYKEIKAEFGVEIQKYGDVGLVVGGFLVDTIGGPLATEVPVIAGMLIGIPWETIVLMVALGSFVATFLIYLIGRFFGEYGALYFIKKETYDHWRQKFLKYRLVTMALGALTPVPYVTVCMISGVFGVKLWEYFVFAYLARVVRILVDVYVVLLFQNLI